MLAPPVALTVGGQSYRVHSDADPDTLQRLARFVDDRILNSSATGRISPSQALLYAALTLADDLEKERDLRRSIETKAFASLQEVLRRIDSALDATEFLLSEDAPRPSPAAPT